MGVPDAREHQANTRENPSGRLYGWPRVLPAGLGAQVELIFVFSSNRPGGMDLYYARFENPCG
jgi:hypothetical protein